MRTSSDIYCTFILIISEDGQCIILLCKISGNSLIAIYSNDQWVVGRSHITCPSCKCIMLCWSCGKSKFRTLEISSSICACNRTITIHIDCHIIFWGSCNQCNSLRLRSRSGACIIGRRNSILIETLCRGRH